MGMEVDIVVSEMELDESEDKMSCRTVLREKPSVDTVMERHHWLEWPFSKLGPGESMIWVFWRVSWVLPFPDWDGRVDVELCRI